MRRKQSAKLAVLIFFILLNVPACSGQENQVQQANKSPEQETDRIIAEKADTEETDPQQTDEPVVEETTPEQIPEIFLQMLKNNPLHRSGVLSSDQRYYACEERSSIVLVQLPTAEEYQADNTIVPRVLFTDGRRKKSSFDEIEADYARRLQQPRLTKEELNEVRNKLRSVYDWRNFYYLIFSSDGRYLAYLGLDNFGSNRTCTFYVLDLEGHCKLYTLPVKENSEYPEINWQADNQTLEVYFPWAENIKGGSLALRRRWHIPSGQIDLTYYNAEDGQEIDLAEAQRAIDEYELTEAERSKAAEEFARLTVEEQVASLTPEELTKEYERYFSFVPQQVKELQERGYSEETISKMDRIDFEREEKDWLISELAISNLKDFYPELKDEDLSHWTYQEYEDYILPRAEAGNYPPEALKQEILERGLPDDITSQVAKEFQGWESMLSYTNEAIMALYEAVRESNTVFSKAEEYRLEVRDVYLQKNE